MRLIINLDWDSDYIHHTKLFRNKHVSRNVGFNFSFKSYLHCPVASFSARKLKISLNVLIPKANLSWSPT